MRLKLEIEPIPGASWGLSLANLLPPEEWNELRKKCLEKAAYTCEICEEGDSELHAHEVWEYNLHTKIQRLKALECTCRKCHDVHHMGRSKAVYPQKYINELIAHWCKVNHKTVKDFHLYEQEIHQLNKKRFGITFIVKVGRRTLA